MCLPNISLYEQHYAVFTAQ